MPKYLSLLTFCDSLGHDALYIEDPDKYGLPQGIVPPFEHPNKLDPPPNNFYVVSILHQLHCLVSCHLPFSLRRFYPTVY